MTPKFLGHILMTKPQSLWRGHCDRTGSHLKELKHHKWMKIMLSKEMEDIAVPAISKMQSWWRGRHQRQLMQLMLKALADHKEELRLKKEKAFQSDVVNAPGLLGKLGVKMDLTKMNSRKKSFSRAFSFKGFTGKKLKKHSANMLQNWWRSILAKRKVKELKKLEAIAKNKYKHEASTIIQKRIRGNQCRAKLYHIQLVKAVIVCQKHWKGRGLRWMAGLMMKYTREVVLMQKYMRRHLIRTKMKRKRRRGMGKVTKFKICNRVMRGYLGRKKFTELLMESHYLDEIKDFGAGLYRNALVSECVNWGCNQMKARRREEKGVEWVE